MDLERGKGKNDTELRRYEKVMALLGSVMKSKCPRCKGSGRIDCPVCKGKGKIPPESIDLGFKRQWTVCPDRECRGTGQITCPNCQGSGWL